MKLNVQKRIVADMMDVSPKRVSFDTERLEDIKEAITKAHLRSLVKEGAIKVNPEKNTSRGRARKILEQKRKGQRKGQGSRKGKKTARQPSKEVWMNKIRALREIIKVLRDKEMIDPSTYQDLYGKTKGGFFRSKRHLRLYIEEQELIKK